MTKYFYITLFCLGFTMYGKSQTTLFDSVYFNNFNNLNNEVESVLSTIKFNTGAVSVVLGDNVANGLNISFLSLTDSVGKEKFRYTFPNTPQFYYNPSGICVVNNKVVTIGTSLDTANQNNGQILFGVFSNTLDSVDYKTCPFSLPTGQINHVLFDGVNSIYGVGFTKTVGAYSDIQVVKFDTIGNLIWKNNYGLLNRNETATTIQLIGSDSLFIGGFNIESGNADGNAILLDTAGNQIWFHYIDIQSKENIFAGGFLHPDGGYIMAGSLYYTGTGNDLSITKLSPSGFKLWDKIYSLGIKHDFVQYCFLDTNDSTIIAVGGNNNVPQFHEAALAVKYTMEGDTMWTRTYDKSYNLNGYIDHFYKGIATNDGGYLFAGQTTNGVIPGKTDAWLLKTDSIGCHPNYPCWPATHYNYTGLKNNVYSSFNLSVFPNPATNYVCVKFKNINQNNACTLKLYTIAGQLVKKQTFNYVNPIALLNVQDVEQGMYVLEIETLYGTERVKIIKE